METMPSLTFSEIKKGKCGLCEREALIASFLTGNPKPPWKVEICLQDLEALIPAHRSEYNRKELEKAKNQIVAVINQATNNWFKDQTLATVKATRFETLLKIRAMPWRKRLLKKYLCVQEVFIEDGTKESPADSGKVSQSA